MFRRVRIAGQSMAPTLREGETLLVNTRAYRAAPPRVGDVVLAWHPDGSRKIVKRVVRAPEGVQVPSMGLYVRGDNPTMTTDSDTFGPIDRRQVLGKVWFSTSRWRRIR
jgi:nickel-type superoxide dismutase maturation protease